MYKEGIVSLLSVGEGRSETEKADERAVKRSSRVRRGEERPAVFCALLAAHPIENRTFALTSVLKQMCSS